MKRIIYSESRVGFTLIELIITLAILMVVAVIVIPAVRTLNKDRKVHDTARVVGSVFAAARERAAVDGSAGVEIVPLANSSGGFNIPNMGMAVYQLRAIPPWTGDFANSTATVTGPAGNDPLNNETYYNVDLDNPVDDALAAGVRVNDYVEFNNSGILYRISDVPPPTASSFSFAVNGIDGLPPVSPITPTAVPGPPVTVPLPFKIYRQPVRIESSVVQLPRNLFLNLSWSGFGMSGRQFGWDDVLPIPPANASIKIWFNHDGSIDLVTDREYGVMVPVDGPLFILMCTGEGDEVDVTIPGAQRFIEDDNNLWIVVDHRNGGVTLGAIAELGAAVTGPEKIAASRLLAKNRGSTTP